MPSESDARFERERNKKKSLAALHQIKGDLKLCRRKRKIFCFPLGLSIFFFGRFNAPLPFFTSHFLSICSKRLSARKAFQQITKATMKVKTACVIEFVVVVVVIYCSNGFKAVEKCRRSSHNSWYIRVALDEFQPRLKSDLKSLSVAIFFGFHTLYTSSTFAWLPALECIW